jgi:uncharacterized protein YajQ (UPF0234 family)
MQEVDNAVNQANKEIATRYDFRNSKSHFTFDKTKKLIQALADDEYKMTAMLDILNTKAIKRGLSLQSFKKGNIYDGGGMTKRSEITLITGIEMEKAKEITKAVKESKLKVQAQIQDDKIRISGKKRDDLQEAIAFLKTKNFEIPLQFGNFRD